MSLVVLTTEDHTATVTLTSTSSPKEGVRIAQDGISAPPPAAGDLTRTVSLTLFVESALAGAAGSMALEGYKAAIRALLARARRATGVSGGVWTGSPVVLQVQIRDHPTPTLFDVVDGSLGERQRFYLQHYTEQWVLQCVCLPEARGPSFTTAWSATLTNGLSCSLFIPDIPGDCRALCQLEVTDVSTSTSVVNAIRVTQRGARGMVASDFTGSYRVLPSTPGTAHTDATALGGSAARLTATTAWQTVGIVTGAGGALDALRADLRLHFKADTALLSGPYGLAGVQSLTGGSLVGRASLLIEVTEIDGSGNETIASDPITVVLPETITGSLALTWTVVGSPANQRVYVSKDGGTWHYVATGSSSGSYTLTALPGTVGTPPASTASALLMPELRLRVATAGSAPQWSSPGPAFSPQLGASTWEWAYGGTVVLPPLARQEGAADAGWLVAVQARMPGSASATVDVDGLWVADHDADQVYMADPEMSLATKRRWVQDTRRDRRASVLRTDLSTTPVTVDSLTPQGCLWLDEGANLLTFALEGQDGEANTTDLKIQTRATITPRWYDVVART